jgi:uncharacterized protein YegL
LQLKIFKKYDMKNKRTYYHLIIDRSGSMSGFIEETVNAVNQQIGRIKEVGERFPEQELITSLTLFNHTNTNAWNYLKPGQLRDMNYADYRPNGNTALLDALGITVNELKKTVGLEVDHDEASVVVVLITDGYENASQHYTHKEVASMISELELTGKWTFSYLGATLDAVDDARRLNIKEINSMHYHINKIPDLYNKISLSMDYYMYSKQEGEIKKNFLCPENDDKDEV